MTTLTEDVLNSGNSFLLGLMGKHSSSNGITNSVDVWYLGLPVVVDHNLTSVVGIESSLVELETTSESVASNRNEANITVKGSFSSVFGTLKVNLDSLVLVVDTVNDSSVEVELHSLLLETVLESLSDFSVKEWADSLSVLNDMDLRAESAVNGTEFGSNNSSSNNNHLLWNFLEGKSASGADNVFLIKGESSLSWKLIWLRSSGNDNVLGSERVFATIVEVNINLVGTSELTPALDVINRVLLEKVFDTRSETIN